MRSWITRLGRAVVSAAVLLGAGAAWGQCRDFSDGFGPDRLGCNGVIRCMLRTGSGASERLYVGGSFTMIGGRAAEGVAVWDGVRWEPLGSGVQSTFTLAMFDDGAGPALYAGGDFQRQSGGAADWVARWDGTAWRAVGGGLDGRVVALTTHDDGQGPRLFAGGAFRSAGGVAATFLASWDGAVWAPVRSSTAGDVRSHAAAADRTGRVVVFGGVDYANNVSNAMWSYDGSLWRPVPQANAPAPRFDHVMAYDPVRRLTYMMGGANSLNGTMPETLYAWDGASWTAPATPVNPGPRVNAAMVFDAARGVCVLFGGRSDAYPSAAPLGDTWTFDGATWTRAATTGPAPRSRHSMAYDAARGEVVMFGGWNPTDGDCTDTWVWSGSQWRRAATTGPAGRTGAAMAFDAGTQRVMMFGGTHWAQADNTRTWSWTGSAWEIAAETGPESRILCAGFPSPSTGRFVVLGGQDGSFGLGDCWEYGPAGWVRTAASPSRGFTALASWGGDLYLGGPANRIGAQGMGPLMRLSPGGGWAGYPGVFYWENSVTRLEPYGNRLAVLGPTEVNREACRGICLTDGANFWLVGEPDVAGIYDIEEYGEGADRRLYAAGDYALTAWDGASWTRVANGVERSRVLARFGDGAAARLMIGGEFSTAGGKPAGGLARWGEACSAPTITVQPVSTPAFLGTGAAFEVVAEGTRPLSYQWRRDGVPLTDNTPRVSGPTTSRLSVGPITAAEFGVYDCVVTNAHGSVVSAGAEAIEWTPPGGELAARVIAAVGVVTPADWPRAPTQVWAPMGSRSGAVLLRANYPDAGRVTLERGGLYTTMATFGAAAPGLPAGVTWTPRDWRHAGEGDAMVLADLFGAPVGGGPTPGVVRVGASGAVLLAKQGDTLPGLSATQYLSAMDRAVGADGLGHATLSGTIRDRSSGATIGRGVWRWSSEEGLTFVTAQGRPAPGTALPFNLIPDPPVLGADGRALVRGALSTRTGFGSSSASTDDGLWVSDGGGLGLLVRRPARSPRMPAGSNIDDVSAPTVGRDGSVLFTAVVCTFTGSSQTGAFRIRDGVLTEVALPGDPLPGYDGAVLGTIASCRPLGSNTRGEVLISATLAGTAGLWVVAPEGVRAVLVGGSAEPFLPEGCTIGTASGAMLDDAGRVVLNVAGYLWTPTNGSTAYTAVFGSDPLTGLFPIVMPGTPVAMAGAATKAAIGAETAAGHASDSVQFEQGVPLSDAGDVVLLARFGSSDQAAVRVAFDAARNRWACPADFNRDGFLDFFDFLEYVECFEGGACPAAGPHRPARTADFNGDGFADFFDYADYVGAFEAGC